MVSAVSVMEHPYIKRTSYIQTPHLPLPLVRGWCLLPILVVHTVLLLQHSVNVDSDVTDEPRHWFHAATCPQGINWVQLSYDLLFEAHLVVAVLYHVSPVRRWELLLGRLDRALVAIACAGIMALSLHHAGALTLTSPSMLLLAFAVSLTPMAHLDSVNLGINTLIPLVGGAELILLLVGGTPLPPKLGELMQNVGFNLAATMAAGMLYVMEASGRRPLRSKLVGWHDLFHIAISLVYVHRFIAVRPFTFTQFCDEVAQQLAA